MMNKDKDRIKQLEEALELVFEHFPKDILKDQMNEDYHDLEQALNREPTSEKEHDLPFEICPTCNPKESKPKASEKE